MGWKIIHYPTGWKRVSAVLRRTRGHCELCGSNERLSVHHRGVPYATGQPGDSRDKHDLRIENLQVLCVPCPYLINTSDAYMGCQRWQMKPVVWTRKRD
jgi:hypothetical protein